MSLGKTLVKKGYTEVKLKKINTNHFEFKLSLNGKKAQFILDTGASNSCLDIQLSDQFNLLVEDSETLAAGAGANGIETKISHENLLKIGKWKYKNFSLVLLDLTHVNTALIEHHAKPIQGIIGADVLEKAKAIIDYKKRRLYLKKILFKRKF